MMPGVQYIYLVLSVSSHLYLQSALNPSAKTVKPECFFSRNKTLFSHPDLGSAQQVRSQRGQMTTFNVPRRAISAFKVRVSN